MGPSPLGLIREMIKMDLHRGKTTSRRRRAAAGGTIPAACRLRCPASRIVRRYVSVEATRAVVLCYGRPSRLIQNSERTPSAALRPPGFPLSLTGSPEPQGWRAVGLGPT